MFGFGSPLVLDPGDSAELLKAGERAHFSTRIDNRLSPGRYVVKSWVNRNYSYVDVVLELPHVIDFVVYGTHHTAAIVGSCGSTSSAIVEGRS